MKMLPLFGSLLCATILTALPAFAVNRTVVISAPSTALPGSSVHVSVAVSTDAADAEQIGFLHAEYSTDNGKTWQSSYAENAGRVATRALDFKVGGEGSRALVRVRIAFRGGKSGDVDYAGAPIKWGESGGKWETPPAKFATIIVTRQTVGP